MEAFQMQDDGKRIYFRNLNRITPGEELAEVRGDKIWELDKNASVRFSHENPDIQNLYNEYLGAPLSEKAHHLLHTDHFAWDMPAKLKPKFR